MKKLFAIIMAAVLMSTMGFPIQAFVPAKAEEDAFGNTGKTYYVDADQGDDSNSGLSEKEAWQSIHKVNATTFEPGDAILLKRGCVWTDVTLMPKGSGDEKNQNYVSCYGDNEQDLPMIVSRYSEDLEDLPDVDATVRFKDQNYWTIQNLSLKNSTGGSGDQTLVQISSWKQRLKGFEVKDCVLNGSDPKYWDKLSNSKLSGIVVKGYLNSLLLEGNHISNVKACGISVDGAQCGVDYNGKVNENSGKGVVVRNNYMENIGTDGIYIGNCYEPLVEYNVVNKSHSYATNSAHVAMWPFASYGSLFQYNEAYDTKTVYDGQGYDCDYECYNTTFQYNYSHDNEGGFMLIGVLPNASWMPGQYSYNVGSTVRYNISENDQHRTFTLTGGIQKTQIYNNTIYVGRNLKHHSNLFYTWDPGANKLTGLHYADDILIANNIFYSDGGAGNDLKNCSNVVYKNNMFAGVRQSTAIENGMVTYKKDADGNDKKDENGDKIYEIKESSGNIWGCDPLFVNPGRAGADMKNCKAYYLYKDSPALGSGTVIDKSTCMHPCETDFFGNPLNTASINIGAYAGNGIDRPQHVFDHKYEKFVDFEQDVVGENGRGQQGVTMSGLNRCVDSLSDAICSDNKEVLNPNTNSTKCLALKNSSDTTANSSATFYTYKSEMENANGIRFWVDPNGAKVQYFVEFNVEGARYKKTFMVKEPGWVVIPFDNKYIDRLAKTVTLTADVLRKTSMICVGASVPAHSAAYVDDIQINEGEMDAVNPYVYTYDDADTKLIEDFETAEVTNSLQRKIVQGGISYGPAYAVAIAEHGGSKTFSGLALSKSTGSGGHYFNWENTFTALNTALKQDDSWKGIQMKMDMVLEFADDNTMLTEEDRKKLGDNWNQYTIQVQSDHEIPFEKAESKTLKSFYVDYNKTADSNGIVRIPFDRLYATYKEDEKTQKVYLKDLDEEQVKQWKENLNCMNISIVTQGGAFDKKVRTTWYMDDVSLYKNEKHKQSPFRTIKEPTCMESGIRQKVCPNCGDTYDIETIPALGHDCEWKVVKEATLEETGTKELVCKRCGEVVKTEEIPKLSTENPKDNTEENPDTGKTDSDSNTQGTPDPGKTDSDSNTQQTPDPGKTDPGSDTQGTPNTGKPDLDKVYESTENPGTLTFSQQESTQEMEEVVEDITVGSLVYRIIQDSSKRKEVSVQRSAKANAKKITIPAIVKINGYNYKVTEISKKAFYKKKKITSVTIGKNVKAIGKQAFYGCTKLKTLKIQTKKLTKKSVQSKAFAKGYKKLKVTVPKKYKKAYKKLLQTKGMSKKARIK